MQTLLKNLFNSMNLLKTSLFVMFTKIFKESFVKGKSRYRKINFFTTSALLNCIIWVNPPLKGERYLRRIADPECFRDTDRT
jgi:hypothetical protein